VLPTSVPVKLTPPELPLMVFPLTVPLSIAQLYPEQDDGRDPFDLPVKPLPYNITV